MITVTLGPQDLGTSLGAVELGIMLSSVLYGVVVIQSYKYYQASFKNDSALLKTTKFNSYHSALETLHTVFQWIYLYSTTITSFGDPNQLDEINWSFQVSIPLTAIIASIVQTFFCHRVSRISGWGYYKAIMIPILVARTGFAVASAVVASNRTLSEYTRDFKWLVILLLAMGAAIDVVNTILLCTFMEQNHNPLLRLNGRISLSTAQPAAHVIPSSLGPRRAGASEPHNLEVHIEMGVQANKDESLLKDLMGYTTSSSASFHTSSSSASAFDSNLIYVSFPTFNTAPDYGDIDCDDYSGVRSTAPSFYSTLSEPCDPKDSTVAPKPSIFLWKDSVFRLPLPRNRTAMVLDNYPCSDAYTSIASESTVAPITKTYIVTEDRPLHVSSHRKSILSGRGSGVYPISEISLPESSDNDQPRRIDELVLKLAWPMKLSSLETENQVFHNLLRSCTEIKHNLPEIHFGGVYGMDDLQELEFSVPYPAIWLFQNSRRIVDRLVVLVMRRYEKLWDARSIEEFQKVFIDCVKCHHHAYTKGRYLHRDLSENNLMIHRRSDAQSNQVNGILNDWDLAAKLDEHGDIPISQRCFRTGTKPFLSVDLLRASPSVHQYKHDLESFFWVLIWAGLHYDLNGKRCGRKEVVQAWWDPNGTLEDARNAKTAFLNDDEVARGVFDNFTSTFKDEKIKESWIMPMYELLKAGYRHSLEGSDLGKPSDCWTFENFMSIVDST
ncbi:hypothetical protein D9758_013836 [Tetrapyrgos nigripes]|uniref:Fungal-type protein kinase domain-containing protein n=1 Tax=Tetrapyrgos nigripes TaxID=182062 RepID=A0A8H5CTX4_9AGAR|nr:hypothetical protein D9758_013836 [Tetrapyrgos nigripes]